MFASPRFFFLSGVFGVMDQLPPTWEICPTCNRPRPPGFFRLTREHCQSCLTKNPDLIKSVKRQRESTLDASPQAKKLKHVRWPVLCVSLFSCHVRMAMRPQWMSNPPTL